MYLSFNNRKDSIIRMVQHEKIYFDIFKKILHLDQKISLRWRDGDFVSSLKV